MSGAVPPSPASLHGVHRDKVTFKIARSVYQHVVHPNSCSYQLYLFLRFLVHPLATIVRSLATSVPVVYSSCSSVSLALTVPAPTAVSCLNPVLRSSLFRLSAHLTLSQTSSKIHQYHLITTKVAPHTLPLSFSLSLARQLKHIKAMPKPLMYCTLRITVCSCLLLAPTTS